ncbi:MAG: helix-turn-helix domain-containing protein [Rhodobacterales bacterium]|nr:helix-turn-helix domain-containing protein [Rhodobacterales bacterium]
MTEPNCSWMLVSEMARLLRTSPKTIRRAAARGSLDSVRLGPRGLRVRIPPSRDLRGRGAQN